MSFPSSPLNNEIAVVNNITYKYVSSTNTWNRIATSNVGFVSVTANTITSNNYLYVAGIDLLSYTQSAFNTANSVTNNITALQGVDTTQNTNITAVNTYAASAYAASNTNSTNITAVNTYASSAYGLANTVNSGLSANVTLIAGIDATQNTNITAVNTYAASAYAAANTVSNNITIIQGVNTTQNTNITAVDTKAQAAFDKANTGSGGAKITTSSTKPTGNTVGDWWYDTDNNVMLMYINDGTSNNWIDISGPIFRSTYIRQTYLISANAS